MATNVVSFWLSMSDLDAYKRELEIQRKSRQLAEAQLEQKSRELYEKNSSLRDALRQLQQQQQQIIAQEKQASIGQLSAGLAHEINNPNAFVQSNLVSLGGYLDDISRALELLTNKISETDQQWIQNLKKEFDLDFVLEDAETLIAESTQGTQRIQRIVQGLRYFTNPDSKKKQFDVNGCVSHTVELIGHELDLAVEFQENLQPLPDFKGMPTLLSLAIGNLLKNAAQSQPTSNRVEIQTTCDNQEIIIEVKDDGVGIEESLQQRIFDPFYTNKDFHNGLGLTISQAIVRQHDGKTTVTSAPGQGTQVRIHLPLYKD